MKYLLFFLGLLTIFAIPCHCDEAWQRVVKTGELLWGSDSAGGAPYVFQDEKKLSRLVGFEVDLADALARRFGVKARQVQVDWDQLVPALLRGDFDIAFNGLEITPDRSEIIAFSHPYYVFSQQITVRKGTAGIEKFSDLKNHRVGTMSATLAYRLLADDADIKIVAYPGPVEIYKDLELGRIDAGFLDGPMAWFYAAPNPKLVNVGRPVAEGFYAAGLRKDSPILLAKFNEALEDIYYSGELAKIYREWNLWNADQEKLPKFFKREVSASGSSGGVWKYFPLLLKGAAVTIAVSVLSMAFAMTAGFFLCIAKLYGNRAVHLVSSGFIELIRGTPLLIQLYLIYYGLPNIGIRLNAFVAAVLGIGMNYAAYEAEIYRAGILSVPKGQNEAARSVGMTGKQSLVNIVLPQALRVIIPPCTNDFVALFKDSSLVSIITVVELTKMYNQAALSSLRFLELGLITAALYFSMSYPLVLWSRHLETKKRHAFIY